MKKIQRTQGEGGAVRKSSKKLARDRLRAIAFHQKKQLEVSIHAESGNTESIRKTRSDSAPAREFFSLLSFKITVVDINEFDNRERKVELGESLLAWDWPVKETHRSLSVRHPLTIPFINAIFFRPSTKSLKQKHVVSNRSVAFGAAFRKQKEKVMVSSTAVKSPIKNLTCRKKESFDPRKLSVVPSLAPRRPEVTAKVEKDLGMGKKGSGISKKVKIRTSKEKATVTSLFSLFDIPKPTTILVAYRDVVLFRSSYSTSPFLGR